MSDIAKCTQTLCPNAGHCLRVQIEAEPLLQTYASFEYTISSRGVECDYYIPMKKQKYGSGDSQS